MYNLSFKEFKNIAFANYKKSRKLIIPIYKEIVVDVETPVSLFLKLAQEEEFSYLLESAETSLHWGRYSFLSFEPKKIIKEFSCASCLENIRSVISQYYIPEVFYKSLPRFIGGFVGYLSYELVYEIEKVIKSPKKDDFKDVPKVFLVFNSVLIVYDHFLNRLKIIYLLEVGSIENLLNLYDTAVSRIERIINRIKTTVSIANDLNFSALKTKSDLFRGFSQDISKSQFMEIVRQTKKYILAGDIIQAVLSRKVFKEISAKPFDIYRSLRIVNPSPYMFYLKFAETILIGSSPEVLIRKDGKFVETKPIAGTRPRGSTEEEDLRYEKELLSSKKENAEHIMLLDLARNDLGKICKYESINYPEIRVIEKFSHVMHMVSSVKGELKDKVDSIDVFRATFPAGTVSGAPKVRAMQIISELENRTRGPYAGAVGYFSLSGNMDMAITIRTILYHNKNVFIQTGAGIVADSNPYKEYLETKNKAKALALAVRIAEQ